MAFELPLGGQTTNETNISTKTPNALKALRDGSANMYGGSGNLNTVGGTANAIALTTDPASPPHTIYKNGHRITLLPGSTNTSGVTIVLDGLVAKAWLKVESGAKVPLVAGDNIFNIESSWVFSTERDAWILESNPKVALLNAPNLHSKDIAVKNTAGTVQRRTHLDPRAGNENQIWDGTNIWHNGTIWKFDDDTKPAYLQIFDIVGDEIGQYHAPANPGFDPVLTKIASLNSTQMLLRLATAKMVLNSTGGANPRLDFLVGGVQKSSLRAEQVAGSNDLILYDLVGGSTRVRWDMNTGKMIAGTVPLGRVGFSSFLTTTFIGPLSSTQVSITHNLGTDDVQLVLKGLNLGGLREQWAIKASFPDGSTIFLDGINGAVPFSNSTTPLGKDKFEGTQLRLTC